MGLCTHSLSLSSLPEFDGFSLKLICCRCGTLGLQGHTLSDSEYQLLVGREEQKILLSERRLFRFHIMLSVGLPKAWDSTDTGSQSRGRGQLYGTLA